MRSTPDISITKDSVTTETILKKQTTPLIQFIRAFLLVLIVIGIGLLCTIHFWVPKLVSVILGPEITTTVSTTTSSPESAKPITVSPASFYGEWGSGYEYDYGSLTITKDVQDPTHRFLFILMATSGANTGGIGGINSDPELPAEAILTGGNTATFDDKKGCIISLALTGTTTIELATKDGCSQQYAGLGVNFDGTYTKNAQPKPVSIEDEFTDPDFINNPAAFSIFKSLVGKDLSTFNNTSQLGWPGDTSPQDEPTKTYSFMVRGLGGILESIIMIAPGNKIWAAVISPDGKSVWYYTTESADKKEPPQTILDWNSWDLLPIVNKS